MDQEDLLYLSQQGYRFIEAIPDTDQTTIAVFENVNGRRYIIKVSQGCFSCAEYEYRVGKAIYDRSLELPQKYRIITRTVNLLSNDDRHYLIREYVPGIEVRRLVEDTVQGSLAQKRRLVRRFTRMLKRLHEFFLVTDFTHYSIDLGDVITDDNLQTFKLVDFRLSHYPNLGGWTRITKDELASGVMPSIADPLFDLATMILSFYHTIDETVPREIREFLRVNNLNALLEPVNVGSEIQTRERFWVTGREQRTCHRSRQPIRNDEGNLAEQILFGEQMACLKQRSIERRRKPDPKVLIRLFHENASQWADS